MDEELKDQQQMRTKGESAAVARAEDLQPTWTDKQGNVHRKRILTGDRTTGKLHLGHYVGSLRNRVKLQHDYDTYILMADIQALTTHWENPKILKQSVMDVALDYMAVGLMPYTGGEDDGSKAKIVIQSMVPAIAELTVYYGLVTPMSVIKSNPTTKAEAQQYGMQAEDKQSEIYTHTYLPELNAEVVLWIKQEFSDLSDVRESIAIPAFEKLLGESDVSLQSEIANDLLPALSNMTPAVRGDKPASKDEINEILSLVSQKPSFKRKLREQIIALSREKGQATMTYGFLGYPVSQAADITFVNAHLVPVGEDQVPHIELTREVVRRMNRQYGGRSRILVEPQALVGGSGTLKALDGSAKMSKSLGNAIYLSDKDDQIWSQLKRAVTDPQRVRRDDPGRPEVCNVFAYHNHFNEDTEQSIKDADLNVPTVDETASLCRSAGIGCVDCKKNLMQKLTAMLDPIRERRADWEKRPDDLQDVLLEGTRRGAEEGQKTLERVQSAMKLDYFKKRKK